MRQTQAITDICTLLKVSIAVFLVWKSLETRISKVWSKKKTCPYQLLQRRIKEYLSTVLTKPY